MRISEGEEREKGTEGISESIMTKDYLNQCQTPNCRSRKHREHQAGKESKTLYLPTIIFKWHKIKEKILKEATRRKKSYLQRSKGKNYIWLLLKKHASKKREEHKFWMKETHQPRIPYPAKLSFTSEGEIKTFSAHKNWWNLLPTDVPCKKCQKHSSERSINNTGHKLIHINKGRTSKKE